MEVKQDERERERERQRDTLKRHGRLPTVRVIHPNLTHTKGRKVLPDSKNQEYKRDKHVYMAQVYPLLSITERCVPHSRRFCIIACAVFARNLE